MQRDVRVGAAVTGAGGRRPEEDAGETPDPRFSFANERTFLAWIRTALALVAGGLAATQVLPPLDVPGGRRVLGLPLVGLGAVVALASLRRWRANEEALRRRRPLPHTRLVEVLAFGVALVALLAVIFAVLSVPEAR